MKCCSADCTAEAEVAVYWPSSTGPVPMCRPCARRALTVAEVMGFKLPIGKLDPLLEPLAVEVEGILEGLPERKT